MPVTGGKQVANRLRQTPARIRVRLQDAIEDSAVLVLQDMRAYTPYDYDNPGPHARDGLTIRYEENRLTAYVGLPTRNLAQDYFWFRFLDGGTRGGEVTVRNRRGEGFYTMSVPARPALRIRERALEGNLAAVRQAIQDALQNGIRSVR